MKYIDFISQMEIQEFRRAHQITVGGKYVPNPIMTFEEASFPGNVKYQFVWSRNLILFVFCFYLGVEMSLSVTMLGLLATEP